MLLAIDIGNTNIVIGCIEGEKILHELRLATDLVKTSDQYWMDLKGVLALYDLRAEEIEGVIISSVVPPRGSRSDSSRKNRRKCRCG